MAWPVKEEGGMPTVTFEHQTLHILQLGANITHDPELWRDKLDKIGCVVEECDENTVEIEVFPDRPDQMLNQHYQSQLAQSR
jgi:hypothetical protein